MKKRQEDNFLEGIFTALKSQCSLKDCEFDGTTASYLFLSLFSFVWNLYKSPILFIVYLENQSR